MDNLRLRLQLLSAAAYLTDLPGVERQWLCARAFSPAPFSQDEIDQLKRTYFPEEVEP